MNVWLSIVVLSGLIIGVLAARAVWILKSERRDDPRGSLPGKGYHIIEAQYFSGAGGGGQQSTYRVPKDPQEYAKGFVPRQKDRQNGDHR